MSYNKVMRLVCYVKRDNCATMPSFYLAVQQREGPVIFKGISDIKKTFSITKQFFNKNGHTKITEIYSINKHIYIYLTKHVKEIRETFNK